MTHHQQCHSAESGSFNSRVHWQHLKAVCNRYTRRKTAHTQLTEGYSEYSRLLIKWNETMECNVYLLKHCCGNRNITSAHVHLYLTVYHYKCLCRILQRNIAINWKHGTIQNTAADVLGLRGNEQHWESFARHRIKDVEPRWDLWKLSLRYLATFSATCHRNTISSL